MKRYDGIFQSIMDGDEKRAVTLTRELVAQGVGPVEILEQGMIPAMNQLGELLTREERFVPQILLSARAMQSAVTVLQSSLAEEWAGELRHDKVIVGTVQGDIHTIGKNLVGIMLQSAGFHVIDLGYDVSAADFSEAIRSSGARIVAMSAMLTTSMTSMRKTIQALQGENFGHSLCIIVGGVPITPNFARELRVHYSGNMLESVRLSIDAARKENPT